MPRTSAAAPTADAGAPPARGATRAIVNARIHPMVTPDAKASAMLWQEGTIALVDDDDTVRAAARKAGIEVEDLDGRCVLPGFVDAHMHFLHVGVKQMRPDLRGCHDRDEALQRFRDWLEAHLGDTPVVAEGWDDGEWHGDDEATRFPTRDDIDAVAAAVGTDRPLVMRRVCGHIAVAGSQALPALREHWDDDALVDLKNGLVQEEASLYNNEVFPATPEMLREAIQIACRTAHTIGVTTVGDYCQAPFRDAVLEAAEGGRLSVRLFESIYVQQLDDAVRHRFRTGRPRGVDGWCRDGGLKVFLDGSFGGHTALLRERYLDKDTKGTAIWSDEEVDDLFGRAHDAGIQVNAHAIGDAAIDQGLDAFERLRMGRDGKDGSAAWPQGSGGPSLPPWDDNALRHRFEHYELPQEDAIDRTVAAGVWACSQPNFVGEWSSKGGMYEKRLGERFLLANRFRTLKERGVRFGFGSDGMPFGPLRGVQACLDHPDEGERLAVEEAIWYYTHAAARLVHWEDQVGTLETGKKADLLILDVRDLAEKPPRQWVIQETIVDGMTRHRGDRPMPAAH